MGAQGGKYIDAEKAIKRIYAAYPDNRMLGVASILRRCASEDIVHVIHAYWIFRITPPGKEHVCECSNCHAKDYYYDGQDQYWLKRKYCPNCGAITDKET